ncbi:MAG: cyclase family protein [Nitrospirales bacterium]
MLSIQRSHKTHRDLKHNICVLLFVFGASGCASTHFSPETPLDLTYPFDEHTIYWPNNTPFHWEKSSWGHTHQGYWYASGVFSASEHGGTHIDAPIHFAESGWSVDEIPLSHLTAKAVVLDIQSQAGSNPDYMLQVEDIAQWEKQHGSIPKDSMVFLLTGWGQYWPDPSRYLGSPTPQDSATLHFPGFSGEAVSFLVNQRAIYGIGIDTASIDPGQSKTFQAHQILGEANCFAVENVAHLERLPPQGALVTALPMKIKGGTGGPVRIMAWVP